MIMALITVDYGMHPLQAIQLTDEYTVRYGDNGVLDLKNPNTTDTEMTFTSDLETALGCSNSELM